MNRFNSADYEHIESIMLRAIPALQELKFHGWLLRYANGYTGRSNSVYIGSTEPEEETLLEKIRVCEDWYREKGTQPRFRLTTVKPFPEIRQILVDQGYSETHTIQIMTRTLNGPSREKRVPGKIVFPSIEDWVRDFQTLHGLEEKDVPVLMQMLSIHPGVNCLVRIEQDGKPIAIGRGVLDGDTIGLFNFYVHPEYRQSGYGSILLEQIQNWAVDRDARLSYLQVDTVNQPAINLYRKAGFATIYEYWYLLK